jgi:hypothetical protein
MQVYCGGEKFPTFPLFYSAHPCASPFGQPMAVQNTNPGVLSLNRLTIRLKIVKK